MHGIPTAKLRSGCVFLIMLLIGLSSIVSAQSQTYPNKNGTSNQPQFKIESESNTPAVPETLTSLQEFDDRLSENDYSEVSQTTTSSAISGNPAAINITTGSGALGDWLGINRNGFRMGGLHITDVNAQPTGGNTPGQWASDTLTILDFSLDTEEAFNWKGGLIGTEFLFYFGDPVNNNAASIIGYNSLDSAPPDSRVEIYQLWYRQALLDDKFVLRFGKSVPTYDFNNVARSIPYTEERLNIPAISGAILTPLYYSPTQIGIMPGYTDSATGFVASVIPNKNFYAQYGFFDGSLATGRKTGLSGPRFDGHYIHLAETGANWKLGMQNKPGKIGIGGWYQTGTLTSINGNVEGAKGAYFFATQRLFYERPGVSKDGLTAYLQLAATNSELVNTHRYVGAGLTYFGPLPSRDDDSMGFAFAHGKMNENPALGLGTQESIFTWYYQMKVCKNLFIQKNLSYIASPAANPSASDVFALTFRAMLLF